MYNGTVSWFRVRHENVPKVMISCHMVEIHVPPSCYIQDTMTNRSQHRNMYQCVMCDPLKPVRHIAMHGVITCIKTSMYGSFSWIYYTSDKTESSSVTMARKCSINVMLLSQCIMTSIRLHKANLDASYTTLIFFCTM
jgi:hypothetical protein